MAKVQCCVDENGTRCLTTIEVSEPVARSINYICSHHPRAVQVRANNRAYDPARDHADEGVKLQAIQFDKDLARSARPQGTSHIHRQGQAHNCAPTPEGRVED